MNALEQLKIGILSHSAEETKSIAYRLGESLEGNQTILLDGDLGTGKTTFVRGLAESCGITQPITSPSYNIFNYYQGVRCNLIHVDAYRLDKDSQLADLLLEDFMIPPCILAVEWPKNFALFQSPQALHLTLKIISEGNHFIQLRV